ncbi:hypothetical protein PPO43_03295 [Saprospira sp. CCB-QB6]|uniref:hypothetical protein n=1 Tax=Saprospira sp. CCB-QB6 TaxID=3023936 RepID=UPI00234AE5DF|nr:hypothetical protein [Saprospira sp. CCB-QB6]WCL82127.1 hypothetical protein PPO43_03295 [Saprospira sp. CCB-QB6]
MNKIMLFLLSAFSLWACQNTTSKNEIPEAEAELLRSFQNFNPESQQFFDGAAKLQCACLLEQEGPLTQLPTTGPIDSSQQQIILQYQNCNADSPAPSAEVFAKISEDLQKFSGASVPGGSSDQKMQALSTALLRLHCPEQQELAKKLNSLMSQKIGE